MAIRPLSEPAGRMQRMLGVAKGASIFTFLSTTLLSINLAQTLSLAIKPLSPRAFRRFNRFAANTWWSYCIDCGEGLLNARVVMSGDDTPALENAIVVANHQEMTDISFLMFLAQAKGRLGDMKWLVKDPIKYVPGIGWGMAFLDCVFVKRNWAADQASIESTFARLTRDRVPVWLISFPEGTRITEAKYARSRAYAKEHQLQALDNLMVPRTKGFVATMRGLRGHVDAVYDLTFGYPDGAPSLWQYVKGFAPVAHIHVRRYPVASLPSEDDELKRWLLERFAEKDRLLNRFHETGSFEEPAAESEREPPESRDELRRVG